MTDVLCWFCKVGYFYVMQDGTMAKDGSHMCVCSHCTSKASQITVNTHAYKQLRAYASKKVNTAYQYSLDFKDDTDV